MEGWNWFEGMSGAVASDWGGSDAGGDRDATPGNGGGNGIGNGAGTGTRRHWQFCFASPAGRQVFADLERSILFGACGPDISDRAIWMREGQRALVLQMMRLAGQHPGDCRQTAPVQPGDDETYDRAEGK